MQHGRNGHEEREARARPTALALGAPTASGKSAVALRLAERFGLEIVSADAMQVYRGLNVGTAKPTDAERQRVPHHGLDLVDPEEPFSVADWVPVAEAAILEAAERGVACLVVGGTGFWLQALADGLPTAPKADPAVQAPLWATFEAEGLAPLERELAAAAPHDAARAAGNPRRVVRALEVLRRCGRPPSAFAPRPPRVRLLRTWLLPSMAALDPRIRARAEAMLDGGLIEEAQALSDLALTTARQAIGYAEAAALAAGELDREEALARIVTATRRYAKRQRTWFKRRPAEQRLPALAEEVEEELIAWLARELAPRG